jgi:uncharacterized membrane protein YhaH (DUF805 family)
MIEWYKKVVFENYANFSGRARRSEYWYYTLGNIIVAMMLIVLGLTFASNDSEGFVFSVFGLLCLVYVLATIIPGLAVTVRRLHDIGKSGWYYFISFIPMIGGIWMLVLMCTEGEGGSNQYGPDPKNEFDEIKEIGASEA